MSVTTVSKCSRKRRHRRRTPRARCSPCSGARLQAECRRAGLSLRRTHTLGVVIPDLMHSFFVEVISGIEAVTSSGGYGLLLCSSGEDPDKERREIEMLRARQVDGIVVASADAGNTDLLRDIVSLDGAVVMIDRDDHPELQCHRVLTDDLLVGRLATDHLIAARRRAMRPGRSRALNQRVLRLRHALSAPSCPCD